MKLDKALFLTVFLLIVLGIVMVYSTTALFAETKYGNPFYFLKRQLLWTIIGFVGMGFCALIKYDVLKKLIVPFFALSVALLILVLLVGHEVNGARRWLRIAHFSIQPTEMAKLALVLMLAKLMAEKRHIISEFKQFFLPVVGMIFVMAGLIVLQPDLGSACLLVTMGFVMLYLGGARLLHLGAVGLGALPAVAALIKFEPYRMRRILVFLNPWASAQGDGYQIVQSFIAIGSGGLFGKGLGASRQKLFYLPESYTDFIFSIIGEELGFIGCALVVVAFVIILWRAIRIAKNAPDLFGNLAACGIGISIALQAAIHIGVVCGVLPPKGLPLPFVSFGGSSLIFNLMGVGVLMNIYWHGEREAGISPPLERERLV